VKKVHKEKDEVNKTLLQRSALLEELAEKNNALLEAKEYLNNILNDSADMIITTDITGRIVEFNKGAERILGYTRGEVVGSDMSGFYQDSRERENILVLLDREDHVSNYETRLMTKNGNPIDISLTISHIRNSKGDIIGTVGISKDITEDKSIRKEIQNKNRELKELNENLEKRIFERTMELENANKELERSNKLKSHFIASMSHELRTPLNSVIGFSDILLSGTFGELNEKQTRYVTNVLNSGRHLLQLINSILDLARIEAGKMHMEYNQISVAGIVDEVMHIIQPIAHKKDIGLGIKNTVGEISITADEIMFKQILYNLLTNAIKFTPNNGKVTVSLEMSDGEIINRQECLKVSVIDTGVGIKLEDKERIFGQFEQAEGAKSREHGGLGLGLALTKSLVEMHGGRIYVESEVNKGSTFTFIIPCKRQVNSAV
ncbi:MAG: PAS domain S-box protein, partial [Deltaproteobacteria bacterium]|nr:PAS domain S-box protein [Deltaproteobacteria bacterium]